MRTDVGDVSDQYLQELLDMPRQEDAEWALMAARDIRRANPSWNVRICLGLALSKLKAAKPQRRRHCTYDDMLDTARGRDRSN